MARLGSAYIPNLESSFGGAVMPTSTRYHETPSNVKFEHAPGDFGGFTVRQDLEAWDSGAYGIVAIGTAAYDALAPEKRTQTIKDAKALADAQNSAARSSITVKAATNQSRKF